MGVPYFSSVGEYKKKLEKLKKENEKLRNRIKELELKLALYGYKPEEEIPFSKKPVSDQIAEILGVIASCFPDYSKAARILSSYESKDVPKIEEEIKSYVKNLKKNLTLRAMGLPSLGATFPEIRDDDLETKIYPKLRILFEKDPNKLVIPLPKYKISPEEAEEMRRGRKEFERKHPKLSKQLAKWDKKIKSPPKPTLYKDDEIEGHLLLGKLYGMIEDDEVNISVLTVPMSLKFKWNTSWKRTERIEELHIALSEERARRLFNWEETPPEFKEGKYRHEYKLQRIPTETDNKKIDKTPEPNPLTSILEKYGRGAKPEEAGKYVVELLDEDSKVLKDAITLGRKMGKTNYELMPIIYVYELNYRYHPRGYDEEKCKEIGIDKTALEEFILDAVYRCS
ncbi:MAG: hypothetical protein ACTSX6_06430 [Candidatus Heimdallarchaeaceae archaeon]